MFCACLCKFLCAHMIVCVFMCVDVFKTTVDLADSVCWCLWYVHKYYFDTILILAILFSVYKSPTSMALSPFPPSCLSYKSHSLYVFVFPYLRCLFEIVDY